MKYLMFNAAVIAALVFLLSDHGTPTPAPPAPATQDPQAPEIAQETPAIAEVPPPPLPAPTKVATAPVNTIPSRASETDAPIPSQDPVPEPETLSALPMQDQPVKNRTAHLRDMIAEMELLYVQKVTE